MTKGQRERTERERTAVAAHRTSQSAGTNDDSVRARAYELFEARGAHHGADVDDWLQAERELRRGVDT